MGLRRIDAVLQTTGLTSRLKTVDNDRTRFRGFFGGTLISEKVLVFKNG